MEKISSLSLDFSQSMYHIIEENHDGTSYLERSDEIESGLKTYFDVPTKIDFFKYKAPDEIVYTTKGIKVTRKITSEKEKEDIFNIIGLETVDLTDVADAINQFINGDISDEELDNMFKEIDEKE